MGVALCYQIDLRHNLHLVILCLCRYCRGVSLHRDLDKKSWDYYEKKSSGVNNVIESPRRHVVGTRTQESCLVVT
jgi:hypothetical protein